VTRAFCSAVALALLASGVAHAQTLQRVTVTAFALGSDATRPHVGVPFHVTVTLRLKERVHDVDNIQLPLLAGFDVLGDVRATSAGPRGTVYRETLTVAARTRGDVVIPSATFDAIDARDGKAKEYSTNAFEIDVAGPIATWNATVVLGRVLISIGVALVVAGIALGVMLRRRRAPPPPPAPPALERVPEPGPSLALARDVLERDPTRRGALEARGIVWRMVGASDGETLADVTNRARHANPALLPLLAVLERAAFTYDDDVTAAIADASAALRAMS
jgi:hypothetical protein